MAQIFSFLCFLALLINKEHVSIRMMRTSSHGFVCLFCFVVHESFCLSVCSSLDLSELAKAAKKKLQSVSVSQNTCQVSGFYM